MLTFLFRVCTFAAGGVQLRADSCIPRARVGRGRSRLSADSLYSACTRCGGSGEVFVFDLRVDCFLRGSRKPS